MLSLLKLTLHIGIDDDSAASPEMNLAITVHECTYGNIGIHLPIEADIADGTTVDATLVGADPTADLAVVKVNVSGDLLRPVQLADSTQVKVGQIAIAIGNPFGEQNTMTTGIISALGRALRVGDGHAVEGRGRDLARMRRRDADEPRGRAGLRLLAVKDITPLEGGLPVILDGKIIGSIGVSGGTGSQDEVVAKAGAAVVK